MLPFQGMTPKCIPKKCYHARNLLNLQIELFKFYTIVMTVIVRQKNIEYRATHSPTIDVDCDKILFKPNFDQKMFLDSLLVAHILTIP